MMKPPTKTLISLAMLALLSCTKESTTDSSMLVLKANRYYLQDESQPYSGQATAFHENGQQQAKLDFVNGSYAGLVKYWDESGEVKLEANIRDGLLHGKFYYQEEDYLYDALYEQGELLSREIRYQQDETRVIQRYADRQLSTLEMNLAGEILGSYESDYTELTQASVATQQGMLVIRFEEPDQLIGRLFFLNGEVQYQENYVDGELSILLYHDRSAGNDIMHCYYERGELLSVSDAVCTDLPLR